MDAKQIFNDVSKIPIIGELIISFAIYFVLGVISGTTGHFGLNEEYHLMLPKIFLFIASTYFVVSLSIRIHNFLKKNRRKNSKKM